MFRGHRHRLVSKWTDSWATARCLYDELDKEFKFDYDPCPLNDIPIVNGLTVDWSGKRVFCNPPYSNIPAWLAKANEPEVAVYLLPSRTDTKWFHDICLPSAKDIRFIRGRLKFGDAKWNAPFPSMVVVFERKHKCDDKWCCQ